MYVNLYLKNPYIKKSKIIPDDKFIEQCEKEKNVLFYKQFKTREEYI